MISNVAVILHYRCNVAAVLLQCCCNVTAMLLQCCCNVVAVHCNLLTMMLKRVTSKSPEGMMN